RILHHTVPAQTLAQHRPHDHSSGLTHQASARTGDDRSRSHQRGGEPVHLPALAVDNSNYESEWHGHDHSHVAGKMIVVDERPKHGMTGRPQPVETALPGEVLDQSKGRNYRAKHSEKIR